MNDTNNNSQHKRSGALAQHETVAVVGAGAMGRGIAQVAASAGHTVFLYDSFDGVAKQAVEIMRKGLNKLVVRQKKTQQQVDEIVGRVHATESLASLSGVSLVIEAIVENLAVKSELFTQLESVLNEKAILTTNTSSLSVTELASKLERPEQFAGMHFFNPAPILPLVEVVKGALSDSAVVECLKATAAAWLKIPVVCGSTPGFIVNRIARPFYGEAMRLLGEGCANVATIDGLIRESGGFKMGPFELTDLIGQDVNFSVSKSVYHGFFEDARYQPSMVQQELVLAGNLGRKTGQGFYCYENDTVSSQADIAEKGITPDAVEFCGDLGPANSLFELTEKSGISVKRTGGEGFIRIDELNLCLTDGRLATDKMLTDGPCALFDLALDYEKTELIALTFSAGTPFNLQEVAIGFFQALGKQVTVIEDVAGMVVMRTVTMLVNEAIDAEYLSVASAEDIEVAMIRGVNYPIGLLQWARNIGHARLLQVMDNLNIASPDGRYRASPLLRRRAAIEHFDSIENNH